MLYNIHVANCQILSLMVTFLPCAILAITDDRSNSNLVEVPTDIGNDVTDLNLAHNSIAEISSFPYLASIKNVYIDNNLLTELPNMCSVGATLRWLEVENNRISVIDPARLSCLVQLTRLAIPFNELTSFPANTGLANTLTSLDIWYNAGLTALPHDIYAAQKLDYISLGGFAMGKEVILTYIQEANPNLVVLNMQSLNLNEDDMTFENFHRLSGVKYLSFGWNKFTMVPNLDFCQNTIINIELQHNPITSIDMKQLRKYPSLRSFSCKNCLLTTIPNICAIKNLDPVIFGLAGNPLWCDHKMKWALPARDSGVAVLSAQPCVGPPELVGKDKNALELNDFGGTDDKKPFFKLETSSPDKFQCDSALILAGTSTKGSVINCATQCVTSHQCLGFGFLSNLTHKECFQYTLGTGNGNLYEADFYTVA